MEKRDRRERRERNMKWKGDRGGKGRGGGHDHQKDEKPSPAPQAQPKPPDNKIVDHTAIPDPHMFDHLKRETEDIAALEMKKHGKRHIISNWAKYETTTDDDYEQNTGADFETLLQSAQMGSHLQLKCERSWDPKGLPAPSAVFTIDLGLIASSLACLPLYEKLDMPLDLFTTEELEDMECRARCARKVFKEKQNLSQHSGPQSKEGLTLCSSLFDQLIPKTSSSEQLSALVDSIPDNDVFDVSKVPFKGAPEAFSERDSLQDVEQNQFEKEKTPKEEEKDIDFGKIPAKESHSDFSIATFRKEGSFESARGKDSIESVQLSKKVPEVEPENEFPAHICLPSASSTDQLSAGQGRRKSKGKSNSNKHRSCRDNNDPALTSHSIAVASDANEGTTLQPLKEKQFSSPSSPQMMAETKEKPYREELRQKTPEHPEQASSLHKETMVVPKEKTITKKIDIPTRKQMGIAMNMEDNAQEGESITSREMKEQGRAEKEKEKENEMWEVKNKTSSKQDIPARKQIDITANVEDNDQKRETITSGEMEEQEWAEKEKEKEMQEVKERTSSKEDDQLDFLLSLQKPVTSQHITNFAAPTSAVKAAIDEDEPIIASTFTLEKKTEDLEDWLDSMLDE